MGQGIVLIIRMTEELQINSMTRKNFNREFKTRSQSYKTHFFDIQVNKQFIMKALLDKRYRQLCNKNVNIWENN